MVAVGCVRGLGGVLVVPCAFVIHSVELVLMVYDVDTYSIGWCIL